MRSRRDYIVTKDEVHGYANHWLAIGAATGVCRHEMHCQHGDSDSVDCRGAGGLRSLRPAAIWPMRLATRRFATRWTRRCPRLPELERRLNRALATELPKALLRKTRMIAIDLTLIPYHGQPPEDEQEIYRSAPKSGTTHFHAYATAVVVHKGHRYTLGLTRVEHGEAMKDVVQRLAARRPAARRENQVFAAGQGVFQRRDDHLPEACRARFHHSGGGSRPQTEAPQKAHRAAGVAETRSTAIYSHTLTSKVRRQATDDELYDLRGQQKLHDTRRPASVAARSCSTRCGKCV